MDIVRAQVVLGTVDRARISCSGPLVPLDGRSAVQLALVLHELATNARKYGALSVATGQLSIAWKVLRHPEPVLTLKWREKGVPLPDEPRRRGFGTTLIERTAQANRGTAPIEYTEDGLVCEIAMPLSDEESHIAETTGGRWKERSREAGAHWPSSDLRGTRILVIEDEPLVAMELEAHLASFGCRMEGPAATVAKAQEMIDNSAFDAALVDANLGGRRADDVAADLRRKGIPFAFATGYGAEALPEGFQEVPVLTKPFKPEELSATLRILLGRVR